MERGSSCTGVMCQEVDVGVLRASRAEMEADRLGDSCEVVAEEMAEALAGEEERREVEEEEEEGEEMFGVGFKWWRAGSHGNTRARSMQ